MGEITTTPINRSRMYKWILAVLAEGERELTAREIAVELFNRGYIPLAIRQATAPRLTELEQMGRVRVAGDKIDEQTRKRVRKYEVVEND